MVKTFSPSEILDIWQVLVGYAMAEIYGCEIAHQENSSL